MTAGTGLSRPRAWWDRRRLRLRLTLLYGGLFFVAGSLLLALTYLITAQALRQQFTLGGKKVIGVPPPAMPADAQPQRAAVQDVLFQGDLVARADQVLTQVVQYTATAMILVGAVALVLGYVVADRALRPLDRVTETAQRLSESTLHERIGLEGPPDEVRRLADTFDAMLDRLHRVFDGQRRFIANASHELRTPLAVNRTVLEVSLEEPEASADLKALARALLGTNARHERLIEGLLLLAQSEQELTVRRWVDLEQVARAALEQLDPGGRRRAVTVHRDLRPVLVEGDPLFLERCLVNLLENAVTHNVRGGEVWLALRRADGGGAVVTVDNTGPVVPPYEVEDLFQPFSRLQGERVRSYKGAGLGLSIVRAIVTAHGGEVGAEAREEGGLRVTVRLPARLP
ncbi:HAMP domain-containing histidine kinase [Actinomadura sp. ATCC 31491]|uniref:histidine kinase n=1 Tax=Actinomadura luzonensis TaxID=2805427 RepID=A0ABT0FVG0_9ACTN|nr:HAMP domain-containing sensor histidine kinase [Actinomadura luzonensis]MCK2216321.1 HAMP domain-containing histidine kinase [Actinomadura luzonensis]